MAITGSTSTFVRFQIPEIKSNDIWNFIDEKIKMAAFKECQPDQESAIGLTEFDDPYDSQFTTGLHRKAEYVAFNFRMDQKKIPSSVVKKHVKEQVDKFREKYGKWPDKAEKADIKENIFDWLKSKAEPTPSHYQVVWNVPKNYMIVGASSTKVLDEFLELFEMYFGIYPQPIFSSSWATLVNLDNDQQNVLNSMVSIKSPTAMSDGKFLGYEFLTWLWYMIDSNQIQTSEFNAFLGEKISLSLPSDQKEKVTCTTQANSLVEAYAALNQGKMVSNIQLMFETHGKSGDNEYLLNLDANLYSIKGLKTPKQINEGDDLDGLFLEKMFFVEEILDLLSDIYKKFLTGRLSPDWDEKIRPAIAKWRMGDK